MSLLETDAQGALLSSQRLGGAGWEFARGLAVQPGGNLVVAGSTNSEGAGGYDVFAIGLDVGAVSAVDDLPDLKTDTITASPNPFNPKVNVSFVTTQDGHARLRVFDLRGRQVAILHEGTLAAGTHTAAWDGVDLTGRAMPT